MKVLIDIGHPGHVHLYKNVIRKLEADGHQIKITTRAKELTCKLLSTYGFEFENLVLYHSRFIAKTMNMINRTWRLYKIAKSFKPDVMTGVGNLHLAHVGKMLDIPSIILTDTEHAKLQNWLTFPFSDVVLTPSCYKDDLGKKQIRYNGYHELAYLHPNYFTPDQSVLDLLGVEKDEKYVIMRFVSWVASHDVGHTGITTENKIKAVRKFSNYARVFITSEKAIPKELEKYRIPIPPHKIHHAMYYATLLFGESATMASECSMLGTPAIFVDNVGRGYTDEQERIYGTVFNFTESINDQSISIEKGVELLKEDKIKKIWAKKRKKILEDKIDVTSFMVWFIENYPDSKDIIV